MKKRGDIFMSLGLVLLLALMMMLISGCGKHEKPNFTYMPDMAFGPSFKAQEQQVGAEKGMRYPVAGTVPRNFTPYPYKGDPEAAGQNLKNPLSMNRASLLRGQTVFNIYCIVCHGPKGEGDGPVIPKFPRPPTLHSDKVKNWPDGRIFHVITEGQNLMPSYASQVPVKDRWAVVHYLRALQKAENPTSADMKKAENF